MTIKPSSSRSYFQGKEGSGRNHYQAIAFANMQDMAKPNFFSLS